MKSKTSSKSCKVAIVTGSSQGIGAGIAEHLLNSGYFVYVTYYKNRKLALARFNKYSNCKILKLDITSQPSIDKAIATITSYHGRLNLLVNNAAVESPGELETLTLGNWHKVFEAGLFGKFQFISSALELLKIANGSIINIASNLGNRPEYTSQIYSAMESSVLNFTKSCAINLAKYGIRVNAVNPGIVKTTLWKQLGFYDDVSFWKSARANNPLGRICTPLDVAKVVFWLASEDAFFLNGNEIFVNGGSHLL